MERTTLINGEPRPHMECAAWAGLVGVAYLPSTVIPVGRTRSGLPIGMQIVGPFLEDRTTLAGRPAPARRSGRMGAPALGAGLSTGPESTPRTRPPRNGTIGASTREGPHQRLVPRPRGSEALDAVKRRKVVA